jgi:hypothetical protein
MSLVENASVIKQTTLASETIKVVKDIKVSKTDQEQ